MPPPAASGIDGGFPVFEPNSRCGSGRCVGALGGALSDYGINDAFMKELAANIKPGNAALFVLIRHMTADKVLREIQDAGGTVLYT